MIWASMGMFLTSVAVTFYIVRIYGAGDMTSDRAAKFLIVAAALLSASFVLLVAFTVKGAS